MLRCSTGAGENPTDPICFADQLANDEVISSSILQICVCYLLCAGNGSPWANVRKTAAEYNASCGLQNVETHQERIQRLQQSKQSSSKPSAQQPHVLSKNSGAAKRRRRQQRLEAGGAPSGDGKTRKQGKLGKRQRAALKQGKQEAAATPAVSLVSKHRKLKRHKPSACVAVS
jgi:hypothetical protein